MKKITVILVTGLVFLTSSTAMAVTATGTMAVSATLTDSCTVSASTLDFGSFAALASTADVPATSAGLQIACTTGTTPLIWSDSPRSLVNGVNSFPFNLSQTSGAAADDLPALTGTAEAIGGSFSADGTLKTVPIYGLATNFGSQPALGYTANVIISVNY